MKLLDWFEQKHRDAFLAADRLPLPSNTWKSDGRTWTPQEVIIGWKRRLSDSWSYHKLHEWICSKDVEVSHIRLPTPLVRHSFTDPVWKHVSTLADVDTQATPPLGRADLVLDTGCFVEFGACTPIRFILNVGLTTADWMIVPYGCDLAFTFTNVSGRELLEHPL